MATGMTTTLQAKAQKRFRLMVRSVRRERPYRVGRGPQVTGDQGEVRGLYGDVGPGANGQTEVGLGQGRR